MARRVKAGPGLARPCKGNAILRTATLSKGDAEPGHAKAKHIAAKAWHGTAWFNTAMAWFGIAARRKGKATRRITRQWQGKAQIRGGVACQYGAAAWQ